MHRQLLSVEVEGTEADGLALQRHLPDLCRNRLTHVIGQALDCYAPSHGLLCIERLDIDVGKVTLDRLEHDLLEAVKLALEKLLRDHAGVVKKGSAAVPCNTGYQFKTTRQTLDEAFIYFLKTGLLPPSLQLSQGMTLEQALVAAWRETHEGVAERLLMPDAIAKELVVEAARKRLVRQFSSAFLDILLAGISPQSKAVLDRVLETMRHPGHATAAAMQFKRQLWEKAFAFATTHTQSTPAELVAVAWHALPAPMPGRDALAIVLEHHWPRVTHEASGKADEHAETGKPASRRSPAPERMPSAAGRAHCQFAANMPTPEGVYIDNAGLVLLHPFLAGFFSKLGVATDDQLSDADRALCLLHYLCTGQSVAPEHALALSKILCDIPLVAVVESDVGLTDDEKEEAIALLEAVIRHWDALRNTSPDGLRGTFLLRSGKLSERDGEWLLQVESNASDILLDQLPWGVSIIKLPWMKNKLWVEWG
ncbi:contractile injection system tape measure protein [Cupriavidus necator]